MVTYALRLSVPQRIPAEQARTTFFWANDGSDSFEASVGPRLGGLGPVAEPNVEFVRLAALVFAADRSTPRWGGGSNWSQREFDLTIPVVDPARWQAVDDALAAVIGFLTGDQWRLRFVTSRPPKEAVATVQRGARRVVLLSGGADSAIGALLSRADLGDAQQVLVSHIGAKNLAPLQREVASRIEQLVPGSGQAHRQVSFRRRSVQPNGTRFADEPSSRSRSLLFLAFGLAVASIEGVPLWIPENGFASLNPPLGPERRGSLSTRTTHPTFLRDLAGVLRQVSAHADVHNPFEHLTKGELFRRAAELVGEQPAADLLTATHSCGLTGQRSFGVPIRTQCGVCFGCLVRRAAFRASGLLDGSAYIDPSTQPRLAAWLQRNSAERAVRDFLQRGIRAADIAAMPLPPGYAATEAVALCRRAADELRTLSL
jgi:hypothetical protein